MPRKAKESKDFEEITLAIALLGGIIVVLLKVIDYSNSESLELNFSSKPLIYGLIDFLLIELLIISLFFILKGISVYIDKNRKGDFEQIARELFKLSFILAFVFLIVSIVTVFLKLYNLIESWTWIVFLIVLIGIIIAVWSLKLKKLLKKFSIFAKTIVVIIFIGLIVPFSFMIISSELVPMYLLTGSYTIEEFSPSIDNPDMLTFTMKEKGVYYNFTEVWLYELNTSKLENSNKTNLNKTDHIKIPRNESNASWSDNKSIWGQQDNTVWYINIINISNLPSGTYLLRAQVRGDADNNSGFGESKRRAEKLFYIPPKKTNYSFNCTQTS